jgi:hypothetical protein
MHSLTRSLSFSDVHTFTYSLTFAITHSLAYLLKYTLLNLLIILDIVLFRCFVAHALTFSPPYHLFGHLLPCLFAHAYFLAYLLTNYSIHFPALLCAYSSIQSPTHYLTHCLICSCIHFFSSHNHLLSNLRIHLLFLWLSLILCSFLKLHAIALMHLPSLLPFS